MITKENLSKVLKCLGFEKRGDIYSKHYEKVNCDIRIDFKNEKIEYPSNLDTGANTTTNFSQAENFVVLECVNRLLEKGYLPETIFLEKSWTLGHTGKSGRADITVYDNKGNAYLIIECKRAGSDYKDARKELFEDPAGKQLFSYWAQARSTQWLQLYASDYDEENDDVAYKEEIVRSFDDKNVELLAKEDDSILLYKNASTADDFFIVWTETYSKKVYHNIIFGDDSIAYNIGNQPIKNKDLRKFKKEDGITDSFREILRHNSISDKENAFNKLLSLFICKFVDEELHREENDIMHFQYIDGKDNYYSLYERLLALFQIGMREFLKEEVFYLDNDYIRKTLDQFTGKKRKELENELVEKFQKTKMLSCQVFAFREVYNEKLFLQNGKVLVEVVELFQNYKISYTSKDQFLGELFENLLDQGFKQEAGQFFTPIPITRFVWNSLPLERYLSFETPKMPKVIDFACGSGHFLTEGVSAISDSLLNFEDKIISKSFYGIDKDNRLARVSKVAMLLNGASNAKIKSGDGLEHDENFLGELNSFDILVANPPYSVDAFKTHESRKVQNAYETIKLMSFSCGDIQNVFIERMHNLLKPQGIAAIVMPSSLLSNTEAADLKTREILLHNFQIRCIANFGRKTFGKTSTNTIILFLEHFDFPPYKSKLLKDSATAIVNGEKLEDWDDSRLFDEYLKTIETEKDAYIKFVSETESLFENTFVPYFKEYETAFRNQASTKKALDKIFETERKEKANQTLKKNEKSSEEQKQLLSNEFFEWVKKIEENKLLIFALTYKQKTLIITAPTETNEQKRFLGYTSSERRGSEGLIETDGMLTNISDRNDNQKLAWSVRCAFNNEQCINGELEKYAKYVQTSDMLDFNKSSFDMQIRFSVDKKLETASIYPLKRLDEILVKIKGNQTKISKEEIQTKGKIPVITQERGILISGYTDNKDVITDLPLIVFGDHSCTFKYVDFDFVRGADGTQLIKVTNDYILKFVYEYLNFIEIENSGKYERHFKYLKDVKIPTPSIDIQRQIVSECEKVDEEYNNSKISIEENEIKIAETYKLLDSKADVSKRLSDKNIFDVSIGRRVLNSEVNSDFKIPVYSANVFEPFGMIDRLLIEDFSKDSVLWGIDGDWMVNVIPANKQFYPTDHCGVLRVKTNDILPKYMAHLLEEEGKKVGFKRSYRASIDRIESLSVSVAPIEEQRKAISEIETYEQKIAEAKVIMAGCAERKKQILDKWLK